MPLYTYQILNDDGSEGEVVELFQHMKDPLLERHPETGQPMHRVFLSPNVATQHTEGMTKKKLSDKNLDRMGFAKYQNEGGGIFRKTTGPGPETINRGA